MRVLFITNVFPNPATPTKGVFNLNLACGLARHHEVSVIAPVAWTEPLQAIARGSAQLWDFDRATIAGIDVRYPHYFYPPWVLRSHYGWFYWRSVRRLVESTLQIERPNAVLAYWAHPDGEAAVRAAQLAGIPSAVIVGGSDVLVNTNDPSRRRSTVATLEATDAVLCVSRHLRDKVIDLGVSAHKVHVWYQGIDTEIFRPGDRTSARRRLGLPEAHPIALWVGRMVAVKGLDVLLAATAILHRRGVPLQVQLIGDGPLRHHLETRTLTLGLANSVSFTGALSQARLPDWYRAADLTVLPSRSEGLPNVLRESRACGTPFVASRVGGIPELADSLVDYLVPPDDPDALAVAMEAALRHPRPMSILGRPASWSASADALVALLQSATPNAAVVDGPDQRHTGTGGPSR